jgi:Flp pilus assembly protein TadG
MGVNQDQKVRVRNRCAGVSVVEFALIVPVFLLLFFAVVDLGVMFWVNLTMQHAVREGARYAITGRKDLDPNPDEAARIRDAAVLEKIKKSSLGLYDKVVDDTEVTDADGNAVAGFGQPGETIVINLNCSWPLLTPLIRPFFSEGTYHFTVSTAMRNEMF